MPTNTPGSVARDYNKQMIHYLRKTVEWDGPTAQAITVGVLPDGAVIVPNASGAFVTTAFAGTAAQTMNIGTSADPDALATALVLTTAGQIELDVETGLLMSGDTTITATLTAGTSPTAGSAEVVISYIPDNDG